MFNLATLLSIVAAAQVVASSPVQARTAYAVKETHFVPRTWRNVGKPAGDYIVHLNIGLKQSNFDELERHLYEGMLISLPELGAFTNLQ